jgi:pullulanase/glycogen debranching enzyme
MTAAASHRVRVRPGRRFPLGATPGPGGTNFAVSSGVADGMLLCLFDDAGAETRHLAQGDQLLRHPAQRPALTRSSVWRQPAGNRRPRRPAPCRQWGCSSWAA